MRSHSILFLVAFLARLCSAFVVVQHIRPVKRRGRFRASWTRIGLLETLGKGDNEDASSNFLFFASPVDQKHASDELADFSKEALDVREENGTETFQEQLKMFKNAMDEASKSGGGLQESLANIFLSNGVGRKDPDATEANVKGAALAATSLTLLQGGGLALSGAAGLAAAVLAVSESLPGYAIRQLGELAWHIGQRVVRLSQSPETANRKLEMNTAVVEKTKDLLESTKNFQALPVGEQVTEFQELTKAVYAYYDAFTDQLEKMELGYLSSSSNYRIELKKLEYEVEQEMDDLTRSIAIEYETAFKESGRFSEEKSSFSVGTQFPNLDTDSRMNAESVLSKNEENLSDGKVQLSEIADTEFAKLEQEIEAMAKELIVEVEKENYQNSGFNESAHITQDLQLSSEMENNLDDVQIPVKDMDLNAGMDLDSTEVTESTISASVDNMKATGLGGDSEVPTDERSEPGNINDRWKNQNEPDEVTLFTAGDEQVKESKNNDAAIFESTLETTTKTELPEEPRFPEKTESAEYRNAEEAAVEKEIEAMARELIASLEKEKTEINNSSNASGDQEEHERGDDAINFSANPKNLEANIALNLDARNVTASPASEAFLQSAYDPVPPQTPPPNYGLNTGDDLGDSSVGRNPKRNSPWASSKQNDFDIQMQDILSGEDISETKTPTDQAWQNHTALGVKETAVLENSQGVKETRDENESREDSEIGRASSKDKEKDGIPAVAEQGPTGGNLGGDYQKLYQTVFTAPPIRSTNQRTKLSASATGEYEFEDREEEERHVKPADYINDPSMREERFPSIREGPTGATLGDFQTSISMPIGRRSDAIGNGEYGQAIEDKDTTEESISAMEEGPTGASLGDFQTTFYTPPVRSNDGRSELNSEKQANTERDLDEKWEAQNFEAGSTLEEAGPAMREGPTGASLGDFQTRLSIPIAGKVGRSEFNTREQREQRNESPPEEVEESPSSFESPAVYQGPVGAPLGVRNTAFEVLPVRIEGGKGREVRSFRAASSVDNEQPRNLIRQQQEASVGKMACEVDISQENRIQVGSEKNAARSLDEGTVPIETGPDSEPKRLHVASERNAEPPLDETSGPLGCEASLFKREKGRTEEPTFPSKIASNTDKNEPPKSSVDSDQDVAIENTDVSEPKKESDRTLRKGKIHVASERTADEPLDETGGPLGCEASLFKREPRLRLISEDANASSNTYYGDGQATMREGPTAADLGAFNTSSVGSSSNRVRPEPQNIQRATDEDAMKTGSTGAALGDFQTAFYTPPVRISSRRARPEPQDIKTALNNAFQSETMKPGSTGAAIGDFQTAFYTPPVRHSNERAQPEPKNIRTAPEAASQDEAMKPGSTGAALGDFQTAFYTPPIRTAKGGPQPKAQYIRNPKAIARTDAMKPGSTGANLGDFQTAFYTPSIQRSSNKPESANEAPPLAAPRSTAIQSGSTGANVGDFQTAFYTPPVRSSSQRSRPEPQNINMSSKARSQNSATTQRKRVSGRSAEREARGRPSEQDPVGANLSVKETSFLTPLVGGEAADKAREQSYFGSNKQEMSGEEQEPGLNGMPCDVPISDLRLDGSTRKVSGEISALTPGAMNEAENDEQSRGTAG